MSSLLPCIIGIYHTPAPTAGDPDTGNPHDTLVPEAEHHTMIHQMLKDHSVTATMYLRLNSHRNSILIGTSVIRVSRTIMTP